MKKNVMIVYAHPEPTSLTRELVEVSVQTLQEQGHEVTLSDLYGMHWKAVFDERDFPTRANPDRLSFVTESGHAYSTGQQTADVTSEQQKLLAADTVIFHFPLWWFSMPAILKGWVDRVFVYGRIYGNGLTFETGPLKGKRAMLALTTGGPESSYSEGGVHGDLDVLLHSVHHGMFRFTGMEALTPFVAWGAGWADDATRQDYLDAFGSRLAELAAADAAAA